MNRKIVFSGVLAFTLGFSALFATSPVPNIAEAAVSSPRITYKLPPNPEKYLFLNVQMVSISNPQVDAMQQGYDKVNYLLDFAPAGAHWKTEYDDKAKFSASKKGFLWNVYHFIGVLPPYFPPNVNLNELDERIKNAEGYSKEELELRETRANIQMNARLQPLIDAGYVKPEEIDDGKATKEFVATVLYRMFGEARPYHGGIDLKDSQDTAVRWAVEVGLPGFTVDSAGYLYPQSPLGMDPGPNEYAQEYAYDRLFQYITLILPGKKTASGWEYYQVKLLPGMVPMQVRDVIQVNGKTVDPYSDYSVTQTTAYKNASKQIVQYVVPRFPQMLNQARKDALKPRVWDWSRDLIHHSKFSREIAAYRKNKSSKNVNAVYQAVRGYYNLSIRQDSAAIIKSVLDNVK
ncbi:hypothetical protein [Brevibacillus sp. NRS-1366]|uniref:hypothetical protein n=1 Tax=Brevibacillus sp. NRS-1366 TaxID=3233899 RepID=UPI003D1A55A4